MVRVFFSEVDLAGRGAMFCCGLQRDNRVRRTPKGSPDSRRKVRGPGGVLRAVFVSPVVLGAAGVVSAPSSAKERVYTPETERCNNDVIT